MRLSGDEFEALFDRAEHSAFRLEGLPAYDVSEEAEDLAAWRAGRAQPERSVRTSSWLARIAVTTAAGRSWKRVRLVSAPPSEYERYEFGGYIESQACGEQIRVATREHELTRHGDFWLFDAGSVQAHAAVMRYGPAGEYLGAELVTEPVTVEELTAGWTQAWALAQPLNEYLAATTPPLRATA